MSRPRVASIVALCAFAVPGSALARIRLEGVFAMRGRVTSDHAVPGEHVGEKVARTWAFLPLCPAGQCRTEELVRSRAAGEDKLRLHRKARAFGHWTGEGSFFAPLRCGGRVYRRGERVFFRITVRITGAAVTDGTLLANSLKATYKSYRRTNRTRCVTALGHDAAVYTGTLMPAPYPIAPPTPTPAPG
jgi:hypothetical protein